MLGLFFGAGVTVFLEVHKGAADAGESVDEADVFVRVAFDFAPGTGGLEVVEEFTHLGGGHLEGRFGQLGGIVAVEKVGKGFLASTEVVAPVPFTEPGLVGEFLVLGDVVMGEAFAVVAELLDDFGVGNAVENGVIDLVADGFGEAGDFAVAGTGMSGCDCGLGAHGDF